MKKTIITLCSFLLLTSNVSATSLSFINNLRYEVNDGLEVVPEITITSTTDYSINAQDNLIVLLPEDLRALFEITNFEISITGSAAPKVSNTFTYSEDGRQLKLEVLKDFVNGDILTLSNVQLRIYDGGNSRKYLQLDLNNDGIGDIESDNSIRIDADNPKKDSLAPYPVKGAAITINETFNHITWELPIDLDLARVELTKVDTNEVIDLGLLTSYDDLEKGSGYILVAHDGNNSSTPLELLTENFVKVTSTPPQACTMDYTPVCGVDGTTYSNTCTAGVAGIEIDYEGECKAEPEFTDISGHWAEQYILDLYNSGIVSGKDEQHFAPDDSISRAELVKMAMNSFASDKLLTAEEIEAKGSEGGVFKDVQASDWFYTYIYSIYFAQLGVEGYENGDFMPNAPITRAEALKVLLNVSGTLADIPAALDNLIKDFTDVMSSDWFALYIASAVRDGFVSGYLDGTFKPNASITRAEAAKIISKIKEYLENPLIPA